MSVFDLRGSIESAERRLGKTPATSRRKQRSDRGKTRVSPAVVRCLARLAGGQERPRMSELLAKLRRTCSKRGLKAPSRATTYKLLTRLPVPTYRVGELPASVQDALYNLEPDSQVPAHQLAFYCMNYGNLEAASFAAGLPWLAIYQAQRLRGYRPKSRGLIEAVARARKIGVVSESGSERAAVRPAGDAEPILVEDRRLNTTGILATKLHAILDRGVRRDFFDLYITLQMSSLGIAECLSAMREVFRQDVNESLLLRALTFFDDAEREAPLPGEGDRDWATVKDFFLTRVGNLLVPPARELEIQTRVVDVRGDG